MTINRRSTEQNVDQMLKGYVKDFGRRSGRGCCLRGKPEHGEARFANRWRWARSSTYQHPTFFINGVAGLPGGCLAAAGIANGQWQMAKAE